MGLIEAVDRMIANWGRHPIDEAHTLGLPAVYMRDGEIVWEYPGGEIVSDEEHHRRRATAVDDTPEKADFRRRINDRYELMSGRKAP
ncbi:hypothetical protein [Rhizobium sp. P007]|uniref:hypothetical protein n=1 Tax=Rhizobium sp. P007 TaxID=285908 RepID=UPI0011582935|nr:hypothetical protein [Rhizobium sp. P007]CAD7058564.1 hypothetical protein RP007_02568 [Rhizobium sp. P007]